MTKDAEKRSIERITARIMTTYAGDAGGSTGVVCSVATFTGLAVFGSQIIGKNETRMIDSPVGRVYLELGRFGLAVGTAKSKY